MNPLFFIAQRFVAGETIEEGLLAAKQLAEKGISVTMDHLGEDVYSKTEAKAAVKHYISLLKKLGKKPFDARISIKLSQIGLAIDNNLALKNALLILKCAKKEQITVEIDMEGSAYLDETIDIYLKLQKRYPNTIQAIQAYLYRTPDDLKKIVKQKGCVRIVKGAYKEVPKIAYPEKKDVNKAYRKLLIQALGKAKFVDIATHDKNIIDYAIKHIKKKNISKKSFEFEMLYGIRRDLQEELVQQGYGMRVYVPYGKAWFPYFYRRIRERKENFMFVLKHLFQG